MTPSHRRMSALAVVALGLPVPLAALRATEPPAEPSPDLQLAVAPPETQPPAPPSSAEAIAPTDPPADPASTAPGTTAPAPPAPTVPAGTTVPAPQDQTSTATVPAPVDPAAPTTTTVPAAPAVPGAQPETTPASVPTTLPTTVPTLHDGPADGIVEPAEQLDGEIVLRPIRFPVTGPVSYAEDFGNCRDACARKHAGNDIIGPRLQPLIAATDGVVDHLVENHPTAGWGVVIEDAEGWQYRYFHMNNDSPSTDDGQDGGTWRFAPGIAPGAVVRAGQILGWMGDSGNSEHSVPHLHFEIRRPDGSAVNPFASLRWAQKIQHCDSPNGPFADLFVSVPEPPHEVEVAVPGGAILIDHLGLAFPRGRAWVVGDPRFVAIDGPCPLPGLPVDPPIAPPVAAPASPEVPPQQ